jgi:hypothetical protein
MSMPSTCPAPVSSHDALFHVLYGANVPHLRALIDEAVIGVARDYPTDGVRDALHRMRPQDADSLNKLRVRFFMLLSEDEGMRKRLSEPRPLGPNTLRPFSPRRAGPFYDELCDELIPTFVQDESITLAHLVERLREAYLHS